MHQSLFFGANFRGSCNCIIYMTATDPCMGSGHILVYAFDVLMQIYEAAGYTQREIAKSILENNLYGLDIDDRAFQLAYFAVMMKARQNGVTLSSRHIEIAKPPAMTGSTSSKPTKKS